ncbi:MAG: translation initiation factor IF-2 subunit beta [Nanoarchaeota archaeon]|nr:translation initiation factor IF-2 subunit beta [Nanoarchaeota archaeon]
MESYENLLKQAYEGLPEKTKEKTRFEIPKAIGHIQGNKTVISNFVAIASMLRRDQKHLLKYLLRELATPGSIDGQRLVLGRKVSPSLINSKINQYVEEFVICPECKKPDTEIKKEERVLILKCHACGAKHTIKTRI